MGKARVDCSFNKQSKLRLQLSGATVKCVRGKERRRRRGEEEEMQWASKAMDTVMRASNNNIVINTFLIGAFTALSIRSVNQQRDIETLETEKNSLLKTNKDMKKSMWEWKQQLYAEAAVEGSLVPLSKLKAIYCEATIDPQGLGGAPVSEGAKPPPTNFVV